MGDPSSSDVLVACGALLDEQEVLRRRAARILHDSSAQSLAALSIQLSLLEAARSEEERAPLLAACLDLVRTCAQEVRSVSHVLTPPLLEEEGLDAALRWLADELMETRRVQMELHVAVSPRPSSRIEMGAFRLAESLMHLAPSGTPVGVYVRAASATLTLEVGPLPPMKEDTLARLRQRALTLGGTLTCDHDGSAMSIRAVLPFDRSVVLPQVGGPSL